MCLFATLPYVPFCHSSICAYLPLCHILLFATLTKLWQFCQNKPCHAANTLFLPLCQNFYFASAALLPLLRSKLEKLLTSDLEAAETSIHQFAAGNLEQLQTRLETVCLTNLKTIAENFGNFGIMTW
jgi:hypothetical protein